MFQTMANLPSGQTQPINLYYSKDPNSSGVKIPQFCTRTNKRDCKDLRFRS